jgi:hypothetical protein
MKSIFSLLFRNIFIISALGLVSFQDPYSIKRISDKNFRYEFYTSSKRIDPSENKTYFWFKGGLIHETDYGVAGEVLNGNFKKYFHSNQLAEQGVFKKGLKVGLWKSWYENGKIETTQIWKSGQKNGNFFRYDSNGEILEKGNYKKNLKHGLWIDMIQKDSLTYKKGSIFLKKKKFSKEEKAKIKQEKNHKKEAVKKNKLDSKKETKNNIKKENWFSKLFKKKKKND